MWATADIYDWKKNKFLVENQSTYQRYKIKVVASNAKGESRASAKEIIGYSGEDGNPLIKLFNFISIMIY